ncbi:hypothetical protein [Paracoccus ravus]|uniref:hypothetical protein n=1 Tax=Paracoccus ravus TaxID=2447760 RepID=UPI00106E90FE|nr:hypothetical protein [Paracoccus ravus]
MTDAILHLSGIDPVLGRVEPTPTGFVFSVEQMILPDGNMPRDNKAMLEVAGRAPEGVHLENINVARVTSSGLYRGTIILRAKDAPTP